MNPQKQWSLDGHNSLGVHSVADYGLVARSDAELIAAADWATERNVPLTLLGGGTNVILGPRLPGLVVIVASRGLAVARHADSALITASAGEDWHSLVRFSIGQGLNGLQNMALIPGSVGAAPIQNIGAYGAELADYCVDVEAYDLTSRRICRLSAADCCFGYRDSCFKQRDRGRYLILSVRLRLPTHAHIPPAQARYGDINRELEAMGIWQPTPALVAEAVCRVRRRKLPHPALLGNVGSVFKNPVVPRSEAETLQREMADLIMHEHADGIRLSAAQLIDRAGGKALSVHGSAVWPRQPLVLIQQQRAPAPTAQAFCELMSAIREKVADCYGIELETEPQRLGDHSTL
ncbi:MAG: UDP-N-acetylmuramate dehydrogenase [Pseudomonadales bacterium]